MALSATVPNLTPEQKEFWAKGYIENCQEILSFEPSSIITLYELKYSESIHRFFAGNVEEGKNGQLTGYPFSKEIYYGGDAYYPIPCEDDGFEMSIGNKFPRPRIRISNIVNKFRSGNAGEPMGDYMYGERFLSTIMRSYNELRNATIRRVRVFLRFIDDINFDGGNPWGVPNQYAIIDESSWVISQKISENKYYVEFELSSPFDVEGAQIPNRRMMARNCNWTYRGEGCRYSGIPMAPKDGEKFTYTDPNTNKEVEINLKQLSSSEIFEYDPNAFYEIGDCCYLLTKSFYIEETDSSGDLYYKIGSPNSCQIPVRTFYVCKKNNDSSNRKEPSKNPDYWIVDQCDKTLNGCKKRYGDAYRDIWDGIQIYYKFPFGGFPGLDPSQYV